MNIQTNDDFENIVAIAREAYRNPEVRKDCVPDEMLLDFFIGGLTETERDLVEKHSDACEKCRIQLMKIETDLMEWEMKLESRPDKAVTQALTAAGVRQVLQCLEKKSSSFRPALDRFSDAIIRWTSPIWKPMWAGEIVTADDIPVQEQIFPTDEGNLEITCSWEGRYEDDPAYIRLNWKVRMAAESELWVRFLDPKTELVLFEGRLGDESAGQEDFTSDELGFDPSSQQWALSIIMLEKKQ